MTAALFFLIRLYRTLLNSDASLQLVSGRHQHVWTSRQLARSAGDREVRISFGMAALFCWQQFVMVAANLFTEENFAYYDFMLSHVAKGYQQGHGRKLVSFCI